MVGPSELIHRIESYVDTSRSPSQQVKEMRMYLSTTDNVIRARDWRALRGALVGCLALLRRKANAGMVSAGDAKVVAKTYLESLQVQALGHHDRKIGFALSFCNAFECTIPMKLHRRNKKDT